MWKQHAGTPWLYNDDDIDNTYISNKTGSFLSVWQVSSHFFFYSYFKAEEWGFLGTKISSVKITGILGLLLFSC